MEVVPTTQFRTHLPTYLHRAEEGEEIIITAHNKIIARLVPPQSRKEAAEKMLKKLQATCSVGDVISPIESSWKTK